MNKQKQLFVRTSKANWRAVTNIDGDTALIFLKPSLEPTGFSVWDVNIIAGNNNGQLKFLDSAYRFDAVDGKSLMAIGGIEVYKPPYYGKIEPENTEYGFIVDERSIDDCGDDKNVRFNAWSGNIYVETDTDKSTTENVVLFYCRLIEFLRHLGYTKINLLIDDFSCCIDYDITSEAKRQEVGELYNRNMSAYYGSSVDTVAAFTRHMKPLYAAWILSVVSGVLKRTNVDCIYYAEDVIDVNTGKLFLI